MTLDLTALDATTRQQMAAYIAKSRNVIDSVVTIGQDAKTSKGEKLGIRTAVTYLAPHKLSGQNVCAMADIANCALPCLFSAGRGAMSSVILSRLRRTLVLQQLPEVFLERLKRDLVRHCKACERDGVTPAYRPNGTSDIRFENWPEWVSMVSALVDQYGLKVYDYTKIPNRRVLSWYDLTYSYSGTRGYAPFVAKAVKAGMRLAVVFRDYATVERLINNGETFQGLSIVHGDNTDARFIEPQGVAVALYAKGAAKRDQSGFVVDA